MEKARKQVVSVAGGIVLAAFGGVVAILGTPWLGWWLFVVGVGATVVALRPGWFMNKHLFGKRKGTNPSVAIPPIPSERIALSAQGNARMSNFRIVGPGDGIGIAASGDANVKVDRMSIEGFGTGIDARDSANVSAADSQLLGPAQPTPPKMGKNQRCFCGSGKRYKNCHGKIR